MFEHFKREADHKKAAPSLTFKNKFRIEKTLPLAGLVLASLVAFEMHQQIGKALEFNEPANPQSVADASDANVPQPTGDRTKSEGEQQPMLAINIGQPDQNAQPNVATITPSQLQLNAWQGASFPVENFQAYTSPFGYRMSPSGSYTQEFHYGLDLAAPEGSYIRNWWTGIVVEVTDNSNCGTSVVVESGEWLHIYCHMQGHVETANGKRYMIDRSGGIQIWEGQEVVAGTRIGRVGMTGRTTGPHLHWGLKYSNNWVDPGLVLRAMYDGQRRAAQAVQP